MHAAALRLEWSSAFLRGSSVRCSPWWVHAPRGIKEILPMADVLIPSLAVGQFPDAWGAWAQAAVGVKSHSIKLGPSFPKFADSGKWTMVYSDQAKDPELLGRLSEVSGDFALPVHLTQLYDSLCELFLFCVLIYVRHRKRFHGQGSCGGSCSILCSDQRWRFSAEITESEVWCTPLIPLD